MLYLVMPVHNRAAVTARFAHALARERAAAFVLVLVDDGCTDDTVARVRSALPPQQLEVLSGNGQLWWAGALQLAYEHLRRKRLSDNDDVLIVNDDIVLEPDTLNNGLALLAAQPNACIQAVGIDRATGTIDRGAMADLRRLTFRAADPGETANCLSTRGLLLRASTFLRSGGFRPRLLPHYLSDYEFTLRLQRQGATLMVDDRFKVQVDLALTGIDRASALGVRRHWADSFSNRAKFNPKHWSAFVVLACPAWTVPLHLARIWLGFSRSLLRAALPRARPQSR
jgi:GT2 family glycosyltransferase